MGQPLNIGIVGCGKIVGQYLETFDRLDDVRLCAVADLDPGRAADAAAPRPGVAAVSVDELLARPDIEVVVNLTTPREHAAISSRVLAAGKNLYVEKPLTDDVASAGQLLTTAAEAGLVVGCAPDTVLGTGTQTARRALDDGLVGQPLAATATMVTPGHERWHPNPDFYYEPGGGPLLDMGPYYVTALVTLLGPVVRVTGAASALRDTRTIGSGPRAGEVIPVTTPTHVTGVLEHASGVLSTLVMSFDAVATKASRIEVHGTAGTLSVPDPNTFAGDVQLWPLGGDGWQTLPPSAGYRHAARGYGVAEMRWNATGDGVAATTADGALAYHVLDVMESTLRAAGTGVAAEVRSTAIQPRGVPLSDR